jgi:hypothetical protein
LKQKHVSTALERVSWQQGSAALSTYTTLNLKSCKHEIKGYELQAIKIQHSKHFNLHQIWVLSIRNNETHWRRKLPEGVKMFTLTFV